MILAYQLLVFHFFYCLSCYFIFTFAFKNFLFTKVVLLVDARCSLGLFYFLLFTCQPSVKILLRLTPNLFPPPSPLFDFFVDFDQMACGRLQSASSPHLSTSHLDSSTSSVSFSSHYFLFSFLLCPLRKLRHFARFPLNSLRLPSLYI